jgi:hypothetical protein
MKRKENVVSNSAAGNLANFFTECETYAINNPKQKQILKGLVKYLIVGCSMPVSISENKKFRLFCRLLDPKVRNIS